MQLFARRRARDSQWNSDNCVLSEYLTLVASRTPSVTSVYPGTRSGMRGGCGLSGNLCARDTCHEGPPVVGLVNLTGATIISLFMLIEEFASMYQSGLDVGCALPVDGIRWCILLWYMSIWVPSRTLRCSVSQLGPCVISCDVTCQLVVIVGDLNVQLDKVPLEGACALCKRERRPGQTFAWSAQLLWLLWVSLLVVGIPSLVVNCQWARHPSTFRTQLLHDNLRASADQDVLALAMHNIHTKTLPLHSLL